MIEYDFNPTLVLPAEAIPSVSLDAYKTTSTTYINTLAGSKILSVYPLHKQMNFTARWSELVLLNETSSAEALAIKAVWDWIKAIRKESNDANTAITAATSIEAIEVEKQLFIATLSSL